MAATCAGAFGSRSAPPSWRSDRFPPAADASTLQATCANFGTTLSGAADGDTIVLTGLCTAADAAFALPSKTGLTIQGAASGTNGFDGTGLSSPAFSGTVDGLTLSNLTFEHYTSSNAVRIVSASTASHPFVFSGDTFTGNTAPPGANGDGGGISLTVNQSACSFSATAVSISGSTFSADSAGTSGLPANGGGGGGAFIDLECGTGSIAADVTDNRFQGDTVNPATGHNGNGGGLYIGAAGAHRVGVPITLTQSGNLFSGNSVTSSGANYSGGGELTDGANLTSTGDRFSANTLPGPTTSTISSEGGGLATFGGGTCITPQGVTSTASNLVAAGNMIGAPSGTGTGGEGAGVYVGCTLSGGGYHMTLINSTISGNSASGAGAVAGIDGESADFLTLQTTIVKGDSGGAELGGFGATTGANVTADASDLCDPATPTNPFTGSGNICAAPALVGAASGDVHETTASPTIDQGNNSDVPGPLTTDYYGKQRIQLGRLGDAVVVDIGAAEFHPATPTMSNCNQLQAILDQAVTGDVITIAGMCTGQSFAPPNVSGVTIQGAATGTNGFDGTGATNPALDGHVVGLTLRNLTIRNYSLSGRPAVRLSLEPGRLPVIDHDRFLNNTDTTSAGAFSAAISLEDFTSACPYTGSLTISNSTFSGNSIHDTTSTSGALALGAGAMVLLGCDSTHTAHLTITGNTFSNNSIATAAASAYGAGLYVGSANSGQLQEAQSQNVFSHNSIQATAAAAGSYRGAGEWLGSVTLTSSHDTFTGNSLPGPAGPLASSEGAGLGVIRGTCGLPPAASVVSATATDLIAAGNSIGAGSSGGTVEGAGVYAGCGALEGSNGFHLTLVDSSVSGNSGPGGVSGVDGESGDRLTLQNSIVTGNTGTGAHDLGGFGIGGGSGSISSTFSDACTPGTSTPLGGVGNVCADPGLAGAATGDVHETSASPTIDAGSNALVPAGLSTDAYGRTRIFATHSCAAVVDIGAAEFQTTTLVCPPPKPKSKVLSEKTTSSGVNVTIACTQATTGNCTGNVILTSTETRLGSKVVAVSNAKHKAKQRKLRVLVGSTHYSIKAGKRLTLHVRLNAKGRRLLAHFHKLPVTIVVTQKLAGKSVKISSRKSRITAHKRRH